MSRQGTAIGALIAAAALVSAAGTASVASARPPERLAFDDAVGLSGAAAERVARRGAAVGFARSTQEPSAPTGTTTPLDADPPGPVADPLAPDDTTTTSVSTTTPTLQSTSTSRQTTSTTATTTTTAPTTTAPTTTAPTTTRPTSEPQLLDIDFDGVAAAGFDSLDRTRIESIFGVDTSWVDNADDIAITSDGTLRVRYRPTSRGSDRVQAPPEFGGSHDDVWMSYRLYLEPGWEFVRGGKLPGLAGATGRVPSGGIGATGEDGFSARMMWRDGGRLVVYAYHPDRPSQWGEDFDTGTTLPIAEWVEITQRVTMNDPGIANGSIEIWIDGRSVLVESGLEWRDSTAFAVDRVFFSTFFGGADSSWAPSTTVHAQFDDIRVGLGRPPHVAD